MGSFIVKVQPAHLPVTRAVLLAERRDIARARRDVQRHELVQWTLLQVPVDAPELLEDAVALALGLCCREAQVHDDAQAIRQALVQLLLYGW